MNKLYLISCSLNIEFLTIKSIKIIYISNVLFYDSLINLDFFYLSNKFSKKILIGKRFNQNSIFKKTIYFQIFLYLKKYLIVSQLKSGDINFFSRVCNEVKFFKNNNINYILIPGVTSFLNSFNYLKIILTFRFNISTILFITYYNNFNILNFESFILNKTIIYYMINNNFKYIFNFIINTNKILIFSIIESLGYLFNNIFVFNFFDIFFDLIFCFITLKTPKLLLLSDLINFINLNNIFILF